MLVFACVSYSYQCVICKVELPEQDGEQGQLSYNLSEKEQEKKVIFLNWKLVPEQKGVCVEKHRNFLSAFIFNLNL